MLFKLRQWLRRQIWRPIRAVIDIFHLLPPIATIIIFLLLTDVGQLRELYVSYLEDLNVVHIVSAVLGFGLISAAIYASHYWLSAIRVGVVYVSFLHPNTGINFRRVRRGAGLLWALAPWLGLAFGLVHAYSYIFNNKTLLNREFDGTGIIPAGDLSAATLAQKALWAAAATFLIGLVLTFLLDAHRRSRVMPWTVGGSIAALLAAAALIPISPVEWDLVHVSRLIGPLGTLALAILFVLSIFILLAVLSQKSGFPAFSVLIATLAIVALSGVQIETVALVLGAASATLCVLALLSRLWWVAAATALMVALACCTALREGHQDEALRQDLGPLGPTQVQQQFTTWAQSRPRPGDPESRAAAKGAPYHAFIIAVEGGGIYAATAASVFLAKLQDRCPQFAEHVFAISGVSGGAIGATIFQALSHRPSFAAARPSSPCGRYDDIGPQDEALLKETAKIMLDDHFSPVVASIISDFLGEARAGRAKALEDSFRSSVEAQDSNAAKHLDDDYLSHWSVQGPNPALVLNATWGDTGFRVAFAPFALKDSGDGTLYSFLDDQMPGEGISLLHAAVISARFPFILPPYSVLQSKTQHRWSFVDGGYSDSSGAATALDLYRTLVDDPLFDRLNVDLKLILLTSASTPNFDEINGTAFRDTIAPVDAVLKVRELLGQQSVARVKAYFARKYSADAEKELQIIDLDEATYSLPLGWKISGTTFQIIATLMGRSQMCDGTAPDPTRKGSMRRNSCALRWVEDALTDAVAEPH